MPVFLVFTYRTCQCAQHGLVRDDLDGTEIQGSNGTVLFGLDGEDYGIALSESTISAIMRRNGR